jgi:hypothetical protein
MKHQFDKHKKECDQTVGWGEPQMDNRSVGSTGQIEEAHQALDRLGISPGSLATRIIRVVQMVEAFEKVNKT